MKHKKYREPLKLTKENKMKPHRHYILESFVIVLACLTFFLIIGITLKLNKLSEPTKEVCSETEKVETLVLTWDSYKISYPLDSEIICQGNPYIGEYKALGHKAIYSRLRSYDSDQFCDNDGKICLIKYKEKVCK